jgi:hypothetical protein
VIGGWWLVFVDRSGSTTNDQSQFIHDPPTQQPTTNLYFLGAGGVGVWVGYRERYFASIAERIDVIGAPE